MTQQYGDFQLEIYRAGTKGVLPRYPVDSASLERKAAEALPPWILSYVAGGCGNEHTQRATSRRSRSGASCPACSTAATSATCRSSCSACELPTPLFIVPDRRHRHLRPGLPRRPAGRPGRRAHRRADGAVHAVHGPDGGRRARDGRHTRLVPALHAQGPRPRREPDPARRGRRLQGDRRHARHLGHRLAAAGPQRRQLPAAAGALPGQLLHRRALPAAPRRRARRTTPAAAAAEWASLFGYSLTWDDLAWIREATTLPDRAQGHRSPRRRPPGHRPRRRRHLLLQPRRTAGQRRAARAGHAARRRRSRRRRAGPLRLRRAQRHATPSRRWRWAPPPSASAAPTPTPLPSAARTAWCTTSGACSPRPTC